MKQEISGGMIQNLMLAIKRLYWRLNEVNKVQSILLEMIKNQEHDPQHCVHIFIVKGLDNNWKQKDFFLNLQNLFKKKTINIEKNLVKLKVTKSKKLKIRFFIWRPRSNHSVTYFLKNSTIKL